MTFIGNRSYNVAEGDWRQAFEAIGQVTPISVVCHFVQLIGGDERRRSYQDRLPKRGTTREKDRKPPGIGSRRHMSARQVKITERVWMKKHEAGYRAILHDRYLSAVGPGRLEFMASFRIMTTGFRLCRDWEKEQPCVFISTTCEASSEYMKEGVYGREPQK